MGGEAARLARGLGRNLGAWLGGTALVLLVVILGVRRRMTVVAAEDAVRQEIAADERRVAERLEQQRQEQTTREKVAATEAAKKKADDQAATEALHAKEVAEAMAMTAQQREARLRANCLAHCSDSDPTILAAPPAERQRLRTIADQIREKAESDKRKVFAASYETVLLERHMNPDSVKARGPKATTLSIRGWFCSKQFMYDLMKGDMPPVARQFGFTKVECDSALNGYEQEL